MRKAAVMALIVLMVGALAGCGTGNRSGDSGPAPMPAAPTGQVSPAQARAIAKEAYVYGFPMVDNYRIQHAYFVDQQNPEYKGAWNEVHNTARVFTPADKTIQTPNSDTPYSMLGADLRTEPLVLTVPPMEKDRYFSLQFIDGYTYNFAYVGSRTTGNDGGTYLLAGPGWNGEKPAGVDEVIRADTDLAFVLYRTQLFNSGDLDNVKKIQAGYQAQPLSAFLTQPAPPAPPAIDFPAPLSPDEQKTAPKFFEELGFALKQAPILPSERDIRARFATLGIGADDGFDAAKLSPEMRTAVETGMADAWAEYTTFKKDNIDTGKVVSGDLFGTKEELKGNYLYRMTGAVLGIYGNSRAEAMYPTYTTDSAGASLDGKNEYTLRFAPGQLPPVNSFWSVTMYGLPESLLVENPINRYLINSPMLPDLLKDPDGGITVNISNTNPGPDREANWLPAPAGPFTVIMRLYWPKPEAINGTWLPPKLVKE